MFEKLKKREIFIVVFLAIVASGFVFRLYNLTVVNGEKYEKQSVNNRITKIESFATRGEIRDRNGKLLAGNQTSFNVKFLDNGNANINDVAIHLFKLLDSNDERHIGFPIRVKNDSFEYIFDIEKENWLKKRGFDPGSTAKDVLNELRSEYLISEELDDYEARKFLYLQGIYLPINIYKMEFTYDIKKKDFLEMYRIEKDSTAKEAFKIIRNKSYYSIDEKYSDDEVYRILALKYALSIKGYKVYDPVIVAENIKKETAVKITELNMDLPGVSIEIKPIRMYPYNDIASHVLGYMGHIALQNEIDKYVVKENYNENQLIGKTGIEGSNELKLTGENGYKYIEINALGQYVKDVNNKYDGLENKKPISGEDIELTIDIELQKNLENYLRKAFDGITNGTEFESKWGDINYSESYEGARLGAGVVVNVKNGEVLALASVPTYDLNLFATGISSEDWKSLTPDNKNNPLAPRPLYNNATRTAVQPGSIYKMVVGYAALEAGLDPTKKLYADGYIEVGNNSYGCWLWNSFYGKHGPINLYDALKVSCNYYFFNIGNGRDYYKNTNLDFEMNSEKLIEVTKEFGLDSGSGIEISEVVKGVPDPDKKKNSIKYYLSQKLEVILKDYFNEEIISNVDRFEYVIDEIVSWSEENPSRGWIIKSLQDLGATGDFYKVSKLADIIKYDYFNLMSWYEGDTLNLSIGQGDHQYTPIQIARYIASIANGGEVLDLTFMKKRNKLVVNKLNSNYINELKKGMFKVANEKGGSAYSVFKNFPIEVAGKTGTAEKQGKIPPLDEVKYLTEHLNDIDEDLKLEDVEEETIRILRERNDKLADLEKQKDDLEENEELNKDEIDKLSYEIQSLIQNGYLNKGYVMRKAIKNLSKKNISNTLLNKYRKTYSDYAWFVSFAPYDDPEIAVVVLIPQGGHGSYSAPVAREIIGDYFNIEPEKEENASRKE